MSEIKNDKAGDDGGKVKDARVVSKITHGRSEAEEKNCKQSTPNFVVSNIIDGPGIMLFVFGVGLGFASALAWVLLLSHK
jgi:hypothetical protein